MKKPDWFTLIEGDEPIARAPKNKMPLVVFILIGMFFAVVIMVPFGSGVADVNPGDAAPTVRPSFAPSQSPASIPSIKNPMINNQENEDDEDDEEDED